MSKSWVFAFVAVLLSGCGQSPIDSVRGSYLDEERTLTAAQLLEHRDICDDVDWEEFEDERERTIVEYTCTFDGGDDYFEKKRNDYYSNREKNIEDSIKSKKDYISRMEDELKELKNRDNSSEVEAKIKKISEKGYFSEDLLEAFQRVNQSSFSLIEQYDEEKLIELMLSKDLLILKDRWFDIRGQDGKRLVSGEVYSSLGSFRAQHRYMRAERTKEESDRYKAENVQKYIDEFKSNLPALESASSIGEKEEKERLKNKMLNEISLVREQQKAGKEWTENDIKSKFESIERLKAEIEVAEKNLDNLEEESINLIPFYDDVIEKFQWIVNDEGESTLTYGEIVAIASDEDENKIIIKHVRPYQSLTVINNQKTQADLGSYLASLQVSGWMNFIYGN